MRGTYPADARSTARYHGREAEKTGQTCFLICTFRKSALRRGADFDILTAFCGLGIENPFQEVRFWLCNFFICPLVFGKATYRTP
jgi:hypothetical protein